MSEFAEFVLSDGAAVRLELAEVGNALAVAVGAEGSQDLAEGIGGVEPISRGRRPAVLTGEVLEAVLRPLSPLLRHIHDAVTSDVGPHQPEVVTAEFGVQIGHDLKLGVVGANGQVSLKISATWRLATAEPEGAAAAAAAPDPQ